MFREEPITDHPLFAYPNVVVTPHLGASTAEANDRAGFQAAEQIVAALTGGPVTTAVNVPAVAGEDLEATGASWCLVCSIGSLKLLASREVDSGEYPDAGCQKRQTSNSTSLNLVFVVDDDKTGADSMSSSFFFFFIIFFLFSLPHRFSFYCFPSLW